jgi:hypothetical protein
MVIIRKSGFRIVRILTKGGRMKRIIGLSVIFIGFLAVGLIAGPSMVLKVMNETAIVHSKPDISSDAIAQVKFGTVFESSKKIGNFYEISITDKDGRTVPGFLHSSVVKILVTKEEKVIVEEKKAKEPEPKPEVKPQRVEQAHAGFERAGLSLFGITGGYSRITSDASDFWSGGFYLSGHGLIQVAPGLYAGLWAAYNRWGIKDNYFTDIYASNLQIFPCLRYELQQAGSFRPFIHAGGGLSIMKATAWVIDISATRIGGNIGIGARILVSNSMGIEAIALYNIFSKEGGGTTNWFSIGLGLSLGR